MCGRFALTIPIEVIADLLRIGAFPLIDPRYNIAPTQPVLSARTGDAGREFTFLSWGLVPSWAKDASVGSQMINARSETVFEKPAFRDPIRQRRCIIPADGFYEWEHVGERTKQPHFVRRADGQPMLFAGVWDRWEGPDGPVESCTILTTAANRTIEHIHHRMPVILEAPDVNPWLNPERDDPAELVPLLHALPAEAIEHYTVDRRVNSARVEDPSCIEPTERDQGLLFE